MRNLTQQTKIASILGAAAFVGAVSMFAGMWYFIEFQHKQLVAEQTQLAQLLAEERQSVSLEKLISDTEADRKELESYVLAADGTTEFLSNLERMARGAGLSAALSAVTNAPHDNPLFEELAVTVDVEGSLSAVSRMAELLETMPYHVDIKHTALDWIPGEGSGSWKGNFAITVTAFKANE